MYPNTTKKMLYFFFWVISRCLNFIFRRFGTLCLFHLHRRIDMKDPSYLHTYEDGTECSETSAYKIQTPGNYPGENIQHTEHGESLKPRMKMNVCLYLIQIHISEPIGTKLCTHLPRCLEETVGYVWAHNISPFQPFRPILSGAGADSCAVDGCWRHTAPLLHYICDTARAGVTSGTVSCAMKTRRSEQNACV
jgi:hypothetical protein